MSSVPPSADNGYTIPLDASMTLALFQAVFTSVDTRLGGLEVKGDNWDEAVATNATELAEAMFQNSVEPHVTQMQDEITVLRASIQDAEDQLTALLSGGIQANNVTVQPITNLTATNAQAAFAEIVSVTTTLTQAVTSLGQNKLDTNKVGAPNGVAALDDEGTLLQPVGTAIQAFNRPSDHHIEMDGAIYAQADYPDLAAIIGTPGNLWPTAFEVVPYDRPSWFDYAFAMCEGNGYYVLFYRMSAAGSVGAIWSPDLVGGTWTALPYAGGDYGYTIAHVDNGQAMIIGRGDSGTNYRTYLRMYDFSVNPPVTLSNYSGFTESQNYPNSAIHLGGGVWLALHNHGNDTEYLARSLDGGTTWTENLVLWSTAGAPENQSGRLFRIGSEAYWFSKHGFIAKSTDQGDTWTTVRPAVASGDPEYGAIAPYTHLDFKGSHYFLRNDGTMLMTPDEGASWELLAMPTGITYGFVQTDGEFVISKGPDVDTYYLSRDMVKSELMMIPGETSGFLRYLYITSDARLVTGEDIRVTDFNGRSYDPAIEFPVPKIPVGVFEPSFFVRAE